MKKITLYLFAYTLGLCSFAHAFTPVRQVQISTGSIPQQSGYYNVAGGTVTNLANYNQTSSGTYTVNGGTMSWVNGVSSGTRFDRSTVTFQGGEFSGTRNDNSTTTLIGAVVNGTRTDNSSTTWTGQNIFNGVLTENSTNTFTGGNSFNSWVTFTASQTITGSTIAYAAAVLNGTKTDNSTATATGSNSFIGFMGATSYALLNSTGGYTGNVGDIIQLNVSGLKNQITSTQYMGISTITLTGGTWLLTGSVQISEGATTTCSQYAVALSTSPGNTTTDHVTNVNVQNDTCRGVNLSWNYLIGPYSVVVPSTGTMNAYLKEEVNYSVLGGLQASGFIQGIRIK